MSSGNSSLTFRDNGVHPHGHCTNIISYTGYFRWKDDTAPQGSWRVKQDTAGYLHPNMQGTNIAIR